MEGTLIMTGGDAAKVVSAVGLDRFLDDLLARLEDACREFDPESFAVPARTGFHYDFPLAGLMEWMPVMQRGNRILLKMVGYHPDNPARFRLPTILCTLALFDARSGRLEAVVDGTLLTALRTGAASAVASRVLAHPASKTIGVIGCGAQAVTQLHALSRCFGIEEILAYDSSPGALSSLSGRVDFLAAPVRCFPDTSVGELVAQSDILVTATSVAPGAGPVFEPTDYRPHLHVNAVGSDFPGKIEIPLDLLERSLVCPDFYGQAEAEGECQQIPAGRIGPELPALVRGAAQYRQHQDRTTVFDSTGWALEDLAAITLLLDYAGELGIGTRLDGAYVEADPRDPYAFRERAASPLSRVCGSELDCASR